MKTENFVRSGVSQRIENAKGKYFTQFMSGDIVIGNPTRKKSVEESIRMEEYEVNVNVRKPEKGMTDRLQPMSRCSEFWIG